MYIKTTWLVSVRISLLLTPIVFPGIKYMQKNLKITAKKVLGELK